MNERVFAKCTAQHPSRGDGRLVVAREMTKQPSCGGAGQSSIKGLPLFLQERARLHDSNALASPCHDRLRPQLAQCDNAARAVLQPGVSSGTSDSSNVPIRSPTGDWHSSSPNNDQARRHCNFRRQQCLVPFPNLRAGPAAPARFDAGGGTKGHVSGFVGQRLAASNEVFHGDGNTKKCIGRADPGRGAWASGGAGRGVRDANRRCNEQGIWRSSGISRQSRKGSSRGGNFHGHARSRSPKQGDNMMAARFR